MEKKSLVGHWAKRSCTMEIDSLVNDLQSDNAEDKRDEILVFPCKSYCLALDYFFILSLKGCLVGLHGS